MKILNLALIAIITLLTIAAGVAKILQSPEEVKFLQGFGFNSALIIAFGVVQVIGGIFLALPKARKWGALITSVGFSISSILIGLSGNLVFSLVSMLPVIITIFIFWQNSRNAQNN